MFDAPVETWYLWVGIALASTVAVGVAATLPRTPPPDAAGAAETVDAVAAQPYESTGVHPLSADAVRISPYRIWLRDGGATGHAAFAYGPVTPVRKGTTLWDLLRGAPPESAFGTPAELRRAATAARERSPRWRSPEELTVRHVTWGDVDVTLVG
jgi:hypothetical protein